MKYVVMMNGCSAFGWGDCKQSAISNAMKYIDEGSEIIVDVSLDDSRIFDATIYVVACPDIELFEYAINDGTSCYYDQKTKKLCRI